MVKTELQLVAHQSLRGGAGSTPIGRTSRLLRIIRTITADQRTGVWRIAAANQHMGDVVVASGRVCYVNLHGVTTSTLGELIEVRYPRRGEAVRRVLAEAFEAKRLAGEALLKSGVMSSGELRACLRDQLGLRLAALARIDERIEAKWCALEGKFDHALTFASSDAYMAGIERLQSPTGRLAPRIVTECQPLCEAAVVFGTSAVPGEAPTPVSIAGSLTDASVEDTVEIAMLAQRAYRVPTGPLVKDQPRIAMVASARAHWSLVRRQDFIAAFVCRDDSARTEVTARVSKLLLTAAQ